MNIQLYSIRCPHCKILEAELKQKNIDFELIEDFDVKILTDKGFKTVPVLVVDNVYMDFAQANEWLNNNFPSKKGEQS